MSEPEQRPNQSPAGSHLIGSLLKWVALLSALVTFLYVCAYLMLAKRKEHVRDLYAVRPDDPVLFVSSPTRSPAKLHWVYLDVPSLPLVSNWYQPLFELDRKRIRPNYWKSFVIFEVKGKTDTNFVADFGFNSPIGVITNDAPVFTTRPEFVKRISSPDTSGKSGDKPVTGESPRR